ncbi:MAG: 50S ribosomal protein L25 [Clostridiaceae bacterium]
MENALNVKVRQKNTRHSARAVRRNKCVPGVIYGKGIANTLFEISELELKHELINNKGHGILNINIDGNLHKALIKEVQRDPVTKEVLHIDLAEVNPNAQITSEVPIVYHGEEKLLKSSGYIQRERETVRVKCKPDKLPSQIDINIANLRQGDVIRLCDVELGADVVCAEDVNSIVALITNNHNSPDGPVEEMENVPEVKKNKKSTGKLTPSKEDLVK